MYMILITINGVVVGDSELPHTSVPLIHDDPSMSKTYPPVGLWLIHSICVILG